MAILPIITGTDKAILRQKTAPVSRVTKEILKLLKDMEETMEDAQGSGNALGIAAPQIGQSLRACLVRIDDKILPLVNPQITWKSNEQDIMEEGCLSLPDIYVPVPRALQINITYTDTKGKPQERGFEHLYARIIQHELDHLDGIIILDYI